MVWLIEGKDNSTIASTSVLKRVGCIETLGDELDSNEIVGREKDDGRMLGSNESGSIKLGLDNDCSDSD
eukprot:13341292-Ditylum_brightwellii.AAC.1